MEDFDNLSVEQIKKMTQGLDEDFEDIKTRLKNKTPLNYSTSTDDLIRQLTEQLYISNKLSVATYKKTQINGSINPYQSGKDVERLEVSDVDYKTIVRNVGSMSIGGSEKVFEIAGSGIIAELKFQSSNATVNNKAYGVRIMSDNSIVYQDTWANFENRNDYETDMTCYEDVLSFFYLLAFKNMAFAKNLIIEVYGSTASFVNIYLKYHLRVE